MAYFRHSKEPDRQERLFHVPAPQDNGEDEDEDELQDWQDDPEEVRLTDDEETLSRRDKLRMLWGLGDFAGVIIGAVVILLLIAVLVSLVNWLAADVTQFLDIWQQ